MALFIGREQSSLKEYIARAPKTTPSQEETDPVTISKMKLGSSGGTGCLSGFGCKGEGIHIPVPDPCGECGDMQQDINILKNRVKTLETLIGDKVNTVIAMTDSNNNEVSIVVLAEQEA